MLSFFILPICNSAAVEVQSRKVETFIYSEQRAVELTNSPGNKRREKEVLKVPSFSAFVKFKRSQKCK